MLPVFAVLNVIYDIMWPFLHKKNLYFLKKFFDDTFFYSSRTTSRNIGGTDAWAVPPPQFNFMPPSGCFLVIEMEKL